MLINVKAKVTVSVFCIREKKLPGMIKIKKKSIHNIAVQFVK